MEPIGAWPKKVVEANSLKNMVGPCGLEPQTSTVSKPRGLPKYAEVAQGIILCGLDCGLEKASMLLLTGRRLLSASLVDSDLMNHGMYLHVFLDRRSALPRTIKTGSATFHVTRTGPSGLRQTWTVVGFPAATMANSRGGWGREIFA